MRTRALHKPLLSLALGLSLVTRPVYAPDNKPIEGRAPEFVNLFLPREYRGTPPEQIPAEVLKEATADLNAALKSRLDRLEVPLVTGERPDKKVQNVLFFKHWNAELNKIDPGAHLLASGGLVRQEISGLYWELFEVEKQGGSAQKRLKEIPTEKTPIKMHNVIGVGSDADFQIVSSPDKFRTARDLITNAHRNLQPPLKSDLTSMPLRRSLFISLDLTPHRDVPAGEGEEAIKGQFDKAAANAGITTDLFAFDPRDGKFLSPDRFPKLDQDLAKGIVHYVPSTNKYTPEERWEWTVRASRALLEAPWTRLASKEQEDLLVKELEAMRAHVEKGGKLPDRTLEAIERAWRNIPQAGANNAIYQTGAGRLEKAMRDLSLAAQKANKQVIFPEFVPHLGTGRRAVDKVPAGHVGEATNGIHSDLSSAVESHLMPKEEFIKKHTKNGELLHGSQTLNGAVAILKGNILLSHQGQGVAEEGRGAYFTNSEEEAFRFQEGAIVRLKLKEGPLRVIDWPSFSATDAGKKLMASVGNDRDKAFQILTERYGIDIIQNKHSLLQNAAVLQLPKVEDRLRFLLQAYEGEILREGITEQKRNLDVEVYRKIYEHSVSMGESMSGILKPEEVVAKLATARIAWAKRAAGRADTEPDSVERSRAVDRILELAKIDSHPEIRGQLNQLTKSRHEYVRDRAWRNLLILNNGRDIPKMIDGVSAHDANEVLGAVAKLNADPKLDRKAWELDRITKLRLAAHSIEADFRKWQARDQTPERMINPNYYAPATIALLKDLGISLAEGRAAVPLNQNYGLQADDLRALIKNTGLKLSDLAHLDPNAAAQTFQLVIDPNSHWSSNAIPKMVLFESAANEAALEQAIKDHPELGSVADWKKFSELIQQKLEGEFAKARTSADFEKIYQRLFRLPTYRTSDFENLTKNPNALPAERVVGLIQALAKTNLNSKTHGEIFAALGAMAKSKESKVKSTAAEAILNLALRQPELAPTLKVQMEKFKKEDLSKLVDHYLEHDRDGGEDRTQLKTLAKLSPKLWNEVVRQGVEGGVLKGDRLFRLLRNHGAQGAEAANLVTPILEQQLAASKPIGETVDFLQHLAETSRHDPDFAKVAAKTRETLLPLRQGRLPNEARIALGSLLFSLGSNEDAHFANAIDYAKRGADPLETAKRLIALSVVRPERAGEITPEIDAIREKFVRGSPELHEIDAAALSADECKSNWSKVHHGSPL